MLTDSILVGHNVLESLVTGLFGFVPEVGAIIFSLLTLWTQPLSVALANMITRLMSTTLLSAFRETMEDMEPKVIDVISASMESSVGSSIINAINNTNQAVDTLVNNVSTLTIHTYSHTEHAPHMPPRPAHATCHLRSHAQCATQVADKKWYKNLIRPLIRFALRPFVNRVMSDLLPSSHANLQTCYAKVQKVKAMVVGWVCNGPYAPDRTFGTFEGKRITYTNSGGGFAAMCAGANAECSFAVALCARLLRPVLACCAPSPAHTPAVRPCLPSAHGLANTMCA